MGKGNSNIYTGKFSIDKMIFYHEKEAWMGSYSDNAKRAIFHDNCVKLLKKLKELQGE